MRFKPFIPFLIFLLFCASLERGYSATDANLNIDLESFSSESEDSLKADSKESKGFFKKIEGLFTGKKIAKIAKLKKAIASRKDTSHNSSYIKDLKKYKDIAKSSAIDSHQEWDSIHQIVRGKFYNSASDTVNKIVFGFHPYWMGSAYTSYDYDLLTDIAFFSFDLIPETGYFDTTKNWDKNSILDSAQKHGCRMHLTISNFTQTNNRTFLNNSEARQNSINELIRLVKSPAKGIDGIVIDFENVPEDVRDLLSQYIKDLSSALKQEGKVLSITMPAIDSYNAFDIDEMENSIEYFLLMGYDYYGSWSAEAGPVAPMYSQPTWGSYSVDHSISNYLGRGMSASQLILIVPYYGGSWEVEGTEIPAKSKQFIKSVTYRDVMNTYTQLPILEDVSKSAYLDIETDSGGVTQIWFDSKEALSYKYDYVISEKLAGVGIWALGYDNGHTDLWRLIEQKFGNVEVPADSTLSSIDIDLKTLLEMNIDEGDFYAAFENSEFVGYFIAVVTLILALGFLLSLRRKEIRDIVFRRSLVTLLFLLIFPTICLYFVFTSSYTLHFLLLLLGLLIGYGIYFIKEQTQFKSNKRMP